MTAPTDDAVLTCTAQVTDASGEPGSSAPTGSVAWSTKKGTIAPVTCTLQAGGGSTSQCAVTLRARAGEIPIGTAPPVDAVYPGDERYAPSEGTPALFGGSATTGYSESDTYGPACNPASVPVPTVSCGDPVNPATGNLVMSAVDLAIGGRGPGLAIERTYNSLAAVVGEAGRFGPGWSDTYGARIVRGPKKAVTVHLGTGATVPFTAKGKRYTAPAWVTASLVRGPDKGYTLTFRDRRTLAFDANGRLVTISDRAGEPVSLAHAADGTVATATDASGRAITFTSDATGRVVAATDPAGRTVRYAYDAAGDLVTVTDVAGATTSYAYDAGHRLITITDTAGSRTANRYDAAGRVAGQTDPLGNTMSFAYSGAYPDLVTVATDGNGVRTAFEFQRGLLVAETRTLDGDAPATTSHIYDARLALVATIDPNGHLWRFTRDTAGDVLASTDPLGRTTTATWSKQGDLLSITTPLGITTRIGYDDRGLPVRVVRAAGTPLEATTTFGRDDAEHPSDVTSITDPLGAVTTFGYDSHGDLVTSTDALGNTSTMTRDELGWVGALTDPMGAVTSVGRDVFGDPVDRTDALGGSTSLARDAARRLISTTDALGATTTIDHDAAGRPIEVVMPDGTRLGTGYDAIGEVTSQVDGNGAATSIARDAQGRVAEWRDAIGSAWRFTWDPMGQLLTSTDPLGQVTSYSWDAAGQLVAIDYADDTPGVAYSYDNDGRRTSMTDGTGTTSYAYDALGRLVAVTDGAGNSVATTYDLRGGITAITYPDGRVVERDLDALGRLVAVRDGLGHESTFEWDAAGRLVRTIQGNGTVTSRTYDARGALLAIAVTAADKEEPLRAFAYERDALGRVAAIMETGRSTTVTRDTRGRLLTVGEERFAQDPAGALTSLRGAALTYDASGRLLSSAGPEGQLTFSDDAAGRRVATTSAAGGSSALSWDAAGRLVAADEARYAYDGDGLRTSAVAADGSRAAFSWLRSGGRPLLLGDGASAYVHGPDGAVIEEIRADGTILWLHADQAGSIRVVTDQDGTVVGTADWDAYGALVARTGADVSRLGFHGNYTDPDTGFQYLLARTYDPSTARFLSVDPLVARTRQPYAFAAGDPLTFGDPAGLDPVVLPGGPPIGQEGFTGATITGAAGYASQYGHAGVTGLDLEAAVGLFAPGSSAAGVPWVGATCDVGTPIPVPTMEGLTFGINVAAWPTVGLPAPDPQVQAFAEANAAASAMLFQSFGGSGGHYFGAPSAGPNGTW